MEIKALGQLHFMYYAEVKETQRMYSQISAQKFTDPLEGNVLYLLPSLQNIKVVLSSLFCSSRQLYLPCGRCC